MPKDGAIIFGDIDGKLRQLKIECSKCGRAGRYSLARLIREHGRDAAVIDWIAARSADCPRRQANRLHDRCGACCPELPSVL